MAIVNGLITLDEAKRSIYNSSTITPSAADVADIEDLISAATPVIESLTGPMYVRNETFYLDGGGAAVLLPVRFTSIVSIEEDDISIASDVRPIGSQGIIYAGTLAAPRLFTSGVANIEVTVSVGSATIPENVQQATRELVKFWWQQGRQGSRPAFGDEVIAEQTPQGFGVPRKVMHLCAPSAGLAGFA